MLRTEAQWDVDVCPLMSMFVMCRTFETTSECMRTQPGNALYIVGARFLTVGERYEEKVTGQNLAVIGLGPEGPVLT